MDLGVSSETLEEGLYRCLRTLTLLLPKKNKQWADDYLSQVLMRPFLGKSWQWKNHSYFYSNSILSFVGKGNKFYA